MISYINKGKWAKNTKSGGVGEIISEYINTKTKKPMVEVKGLDGRKAYWLASAVKIEAAA